MAGGPTIGPSRIVEQFRQAKELLVSDINKIERVLVELETQYHTAEYSQPGSVLKGFDGFLASKENQRKRMRAYKPEDRLFSLSSKTCGIVLGADLAAQDTMDLGGLGGIKKPLPQAFAAPKTYSQKGYAQKGYAQKKA
mmetsp:Transcript_17025/g.29111  ORF Transcript_17025/g.29111 Transcript_17025/m.29111 type:complete len:139 (+) Transcript_17025:96-512(+)